MAKVLQLIPNITMPYFVIVVLGLALSVVWGAFGIIDYVIRDWTLSWEGQCTVADWKKRGRIGFMVDCGDNGKTEIIDAGIVRSYMNNPGLITCRRYLTDSLSCDARPKVKEKTKS